jgi:aspartyl/glutamyl-tRNA(Asn/Gln) amidotransferase C subunit
LSYFELLNEVDTSGVIPTINVVKKENILRSDVENTNKDVSPEELLACSNQKIIAGQIAVNNIMK